MLEISTGICLKKTSKKYGKWKMIQKKYVSRRQTNKKRILERMQKKSIQQYVEKNKRKQ